MTCTLTHAATTLRTLALALASAGLFAGCASNAEPTQPGEPTASKFATQSAALTAPLPPALKVAPIACNQPLPAGVNSPRGLWAWTSTIATDPAQRAKFMQFAQTQGVRTVYVSGWQLVTQSQAALATFTAEAAAGCMQVELLFGAMEHALTAGHAVALKDAQTAVNAIAQMQGPKPVGLQFDIEPYTLPQWTSDMNGTANQYLDLLEKLAPVVHSGGLRLTVAVPFWFDTKLVNRGGVTRPMSELVADRVDRMAVMDYRDDAPSMVAMAQAEVNYASKIGRDVIIGAETLCGLVPETVTFCEEGKGAMNAALTSVELAFLGQSGFAGAAVHHYGSMLTLKP